MLLRFVIASEGATCFGHAEGRCRAHARLTSGGRCPGQQEAPQPGAGLNQCWTKQGSAARPAEQDAQRLLRCLPLAGLARVHGWNNHHGDKDQRNHDHTSNQQGHAEGPGC